MLHILSMGPISLSFSTNPQWWLFFSLSVAARLHARVYFFFVTYFQLCEEQLFLNWTTFAQLLIIFVVAVARAFRFVSPWLVQKTSLFDACRFIYIYIFLKFFLSTCCQKKVSTLNRNFSFSGWVVWARYVNMLRSMLHHFIFPTHLSIALSYLFVLSLLKFIAFSHAKAFRSCNIYWALAKLLWLYDADINSLSVHFDGCQLFYDCKKTQTIFICSYSVLWWNFKPFISHAHIVCTSI